MSPILMLALAGSPALADGPALSLHDDFLRADALPEAPPAYADGRWNVVDLEDLTVVRMPENALGGGFSYSEFSRAVGQSVAGRTAEYDIVVVTHSDAWTPAFGSAAAFQLAYNNADVWGTGDDPVITPDMPIRSALWMNHVDYWDDWTPELADWVVCHEVGHQWLAFPSVTLGIDHTHEVDDELALLGRQRAHWSFFLSTENSPMEGNAWRDNGDGTWTTQTTEDMVFSPLDLYMMGLREAADVPDFLLLEPSEPTALYRERSPQHRYTDEGPVTVEADAHTITIDDVIEANGPWQAGDYTAAHIQALHVVLVAPHEALTERVLTRARDARTDWLSAWSHCTADESVLELGVIDQGWTLPPPPASPALIPGGAW